MCRLNQTICFPQISAALQYYYCVLIALMAQTHTVAKTNSTICTKSTHESHRTERGEKIIVPLTVPRDWLLDTLLVICGGSIGIRASITVFIKPRWTVAKGKSGSNS